MRNDTDYAPGVGPSDPEHHDSEATDSEATDSAATEHGEGFAPADPELADAQEATTPPEDERLVTDADPADADADADPGDGTRAGTEEADHTEAAPYLATGDAAEDSAYPVSYDPDDEADDGAQESYRPESPVVDEGDTDDRADAYDEALDDEPVAGTDAELDSDEEYPAAAPDGEHPVVDNFVDETSGADPYAPPEAADTSGPVASAPVPVQAPPADVYDEEPAQAERADADYTGADRDGDGRADDADAAAQTAESMALAGAAAGVGYLAASRGTAAGQEPVADAEAEQAEREQAEREQALASDEAQPAGRDELMPGEAELAPMAVVIAAADADRLRQQWQHLQLRFIDDPRGTADEAQRLVGEVVQTLTAALASQRDALEDWRGSASGDTEIFRAAVMRYRDFFDRLLSL